MRTSIVRPLSVAIALSFALGFSATVVAQWLKCPPAHVPRTPDGKPTLSAPTPRTPDGKPDFSGIWLTDSSNCPKDPEALTCGPELPMGREGINMGVSLPGGLPYQPWLAELVKKRTAENAKDDPHVACPPGPFLCAYSLAQLLTVAQT